MADPSSHDQLISEFAELTGASALDSQQYLTTNQWDLPSAVTEYYTAQEEAAEQGGDDPQEPEAYTGPRTLDGRPAPESTSAIPVASSSAPPRRTGGIATLGSLASSSQSQGHVGHGHNDDDDDNDDHDYEPDEEPRDLFAGGEKSGLAVQDPGKSNDPRKVVNDILKKARANAAKIGGGGGGESSTAPATRFRGSGQTLGSDEAPSTTVPDPTPRGPPLGETQSRTLHLWENGFSVEDGPLRAFDDPQNAADLNMIRQGRAPLHLMRVRHDQPVDVQLIKHDEDYKPQPKVWKPFSGSGNRLGSPTPGGSSSTETSTGVATPAVSAPSAPATAEVPIDSSQPTLSLRIQLANGTSLPARFNTTHTVGDVYAFIERASPSNSSGRSWVLATTFPNKDHTDKSLVLGDMAEFKRGGTAVQKWS